MPSRRRALIVGATGQDGWYLAELLAAKGTAVFGLARRPAPVPAGVTLLSGDLRDADSLAAAFRTAAPHEVYNLGGCSSVPESWRDPVAAADSTALGPLRLLECVRTLAPQARLFQASSCQVFGSPARWPQDENTPRAPANPYAAAKDYADALVRAYRTTHGVFACSGILYNHESPRRGPEFVTRQVAEGVARVKKGLAAEVVVGSLDAARDWGAASDAVEAMWLMLQQETPEDYVIATGVERTVRELVETAFAAAGLDPKGRVRAKGEESRPGEAPRYLGDPSKAKARLGWAPRTGFAELVSGMVSAALAALG